MRLIPGRNEVIRESGLSEYVALLPLMLGLSLSVLLTPQWLGRGFLMLSNIVTFIALVIVVVGTLWTVFRYGIEGAIGVRVAVYAVILSIAHLWVWRWHSRQSNNLIASTAGDR